MKPTDELYKSLDFAYQHFNKYLFADRLPLVLFTLQRQKGTMGYFIPDRWTSTSGKYCHEISINPAHMGRSRVIDVMQTLVHEMVHCWQFCHGNPSRSGYHNKEWAYQMIKVGLQPSITGEPGGGIVGNHMNDYIIDDGLFKKSCVNLIQEEGFHIPWIYRLTYAQLETEYSHNLEPSDDFLDAVTVEDNVVQKKERELDFITKTILSNPEKYLYSNYKDLLPDKAFFSSPLSRNAKSKYQCPSCRLNVWGKPSIRLLCIGCEKELVDVTIWS